MSRLFGRLSPIKSLLKAFSSSDEVMECEACLTDAGVTVDISTSSALLFFSVYFSSLCCFFFSLSTLWPLFLLLPYPPFQTTSRKCTQRLTHKAQVTFSVSLLNLTGLCVSCHLHPTVYHIKHTLNNQDIGTLGSEMSDNFTELQRYDQHNN